MHNNDNRKYYHWCSQKSFQKITERLRITKSREIKQVPTVFNFHDWQDKTEYLQFLVVYRRFCQLQTNSSVIASLYILQTKNRCTYHVPYLPWAVSISEAKVLFSMFWSVAMVDSNEQRNLVCACLEAIKTHYHVIWDSSSRPVIF